MNVLLPIYMIMYVYYMCTLDSFGTMSENPNTQVS